MNEAWLTRDGGVHVDKMRFWLENGTMRMEGQLIRADIAELSGRIYPIGIVRDMLRDAMASEPLYVTMGSSSAMDTRVRLSDAAAIIEDVTIGNDGVVNATARILDTDKGTVLKDIAIGHAAVVAAGVSFREVRNVPLGFATVSLGDVDENGVVKHARLVRVDLVQK